MLGLGEAVTVGVADTVGLGDAVTVGLADTVAVGDAVTVGLADTDAVGDAVAVGLGDALGAAGFSTRNHPATAALVPKVQVAVPMLLPAFGSGRYAASASCPPVLSAASVHVAGGVTSASFVSAPMPPTTSDPAVPVVPPVSDKEVAAYVLSTFVTAAPAHGFVGSTPW